MDINYVKKRFLHGESTLGVITNIGCTQLVEIIGLTDFDYVLFDMEHGPISEETLQNLVRTAKFVGLVPLVRVRENNPKMILQALDLGACGVMVPQVETGQDVRAVIDAVKYTPLGKRGLSTFTPAGRWGTIPLPQHIEHSNENTIIIAQIETTKGVENVQSIANVNGLDVIIVGPADLSQSLSIPGEFRHPLLQEAIDEVIQVACRSQVTAGALVRNVEQVKEFYGKGVRFFLTGILGLFYNAAAEQASAMKAALPPE